MSYIFNNEIQFSDSPNLDAFGRLRISDPYTIFNSANVTNSGFTEYQLVLGGSGTATYNRPKAEIQFNVTTTGDTVIREQHAYNFYQPGKALRNGSPVLTPNGWVNIELLSIGDIVFDGDGNQTKVIGVYPQGIRKLYKLTFDDGTTVDSDGEHLWETIIRDGKNKGESRILTTIDMINEAGNNPKSYKRWRIPKAPILQFDYVNTPIDPYTLGCLLGDGSKFKSEITYGLKGLGSFIRELGLEGANSHTKFIPNIYKYNSKEVRLSILKGLLDTDGNCSKRDGAVEYTTVSDSLAEDVAFIVRSLGGQVKHRRKKTFYRNAEGAKKECSLAHRLTIIINENPFKLTRKADLWKPRTRISFDRYIHSIIEVDEDEATCIRVESKKHTFLTTNHIVTHNSQLVIMTGIFGNSVSNVTKRIGYYNNNDGLFFQLSGNTFGVNVRTSTSGLVVDTFVPQEDWNIDTLNTGSTRNPSGKHLDTTKSNIYLINFQWLGVGRVIYGLDIDGVIQPVHEVLNANNKTEVYMATGNLPCRYEVISDGGSDSTFKQICSSVISEGGQEDFGYNETVSNGLTTKTFSTKQSVISIRLANTFNGITNRTKALPISLELFTNTNTVNAYWELIYQKGYLNESNLDGTPTWQILEGSPLEYAVNGTTITGGTVIDSGYIFTSTQTGDKVVSNTIQDRRSLALDYSGTTSDYLHLTVTPNVASSWVGKLTLKTLY